LGASALLVGGAGAYGVGVLAPDPEAGDEAPSEGLPCVDNRSGRNVLSLGVMAAGRAFLRVVRSAWASFVDVEVSVVSYYPNQLNSSAQKNQKKTTDAIL
jgi:hypothetical protein